MPESELEELTHRLAAVLEDAEDTVAWAERRCAALAMYRRMFSDDDHRCCGDWRSCLDADCQYSMGAR